MPPNVGTIVVSVPFEGNECHQTCWNLTLHDLTTAVEQGGLGMSEQEAVGLYEKAINDVCAGLFELGCSLERVTVDALYPFVWKFLFAAICKLEHAGSHSPRC